MKTWIAVFVAAALVAAFLGYAGIAEGATAIGQVLVIGFLALAAIALLGLPRSRREA